MEAEKAIMGKGIAVYLDNSKNIWNFIGSHKHNDIVLPGKGVIEYLKILNKGYNIKIKKIAESSFNDQKVIRSFTKKEGEDFFTSVGLLISSMQVWQKIPDHYLDDKLFINVFGTYLSDLWFPAARSSYNIYDFTFAFRDRVNSITRPGYMRIACEKETDVAAEQGTEAPWTYTCGRALAWDCKDNKNTRFWLFGSTSSFDDGPKWSNLNAIITEEEFYVCQTNI